MAQKQVISYPIPPYQNLAIASQNFKPSRFVITAITLGQTTTVTTSVNHNYVVGQLCRLLIPSGYGAYQLNEQSGYVQSIPVSNQVILNIYSLNSDPFVNLGTGTPAQIVAVGDINTGLINSTGRSQSTTTILGTFSNISA